MTEKDFTKLVLAMARLFGWRYYHTHDSRRSQPGFPDLVLIHRAKCKLIVAELKVGLRQPTAEQENWLLDFERAGGDAYCWRPCDLDEIERVLRA